MIIEKKKLMFGLPIQNKNFTFDFFKLKERAHITRKIHSQRKVFKWEISIIIMNSRKLRWAGPAQQNICLCLIRYLVSTKWSNPSHPDPGRRKKTNYMTPFYGWVSTASRLRCHYEETIYFLPLSPQEFFFPHFLVLQKILWRP